MPNPPAKQRALLTALLLRPGREVSTAELIRLIWSDGEPDRADGALQVYVHHLRRLLQPDRQARASNSIIERTPSGYRLRISGDQVDVQQFEELAAAGRLALAQGRFGAAASSLATALSLWRGPALVDVVAPFVLVERMRLEDRRRAVLEDRLEADLALGHHADVIGELEALVIEHPLRERFCLLLMQALYRQGRQTEAIAAYVRHRDHLLDTGGLDPSPAVERLYLDILNQNLQIPPPPGVAAGPSIVASANVPLQLTTFVGRAEQIADIKQFLLSRRLLTLTGPGGVGKTRLAIEVARHMERSYRDGVVSVPLETLTDSALLRATIGDALAKHTGARETRWEGLLTLLEHREILIVLDNCEHLARVDLVVSELIRAGIGVTVLTTSRAAIGVAGEQEYPVPPLRIPLARGSLRASDIQGLESVVLFLDRARTVRPDFALTDDNAAAVAEICARLDGLPLAIELAAVRVKFLPPQALLARLGDHLGGDNRGPPDPVLRQQTLQATIDWSYGLLAPVERDLFQNVAVFAGSWSLDAAEHVCTVDVKAILDGHRTLVASNLIQARDGPRGEARFQLLQTIREYALKRARQRPDWLRVVRQHGRYYASLAQALATTMRGRDQSLALEQIAADHDNMRAVLSGVFGDPEADSALRLTQALWPYWETRGNLTEGLAHIELVLGGTATRNVAARAELLDAAGAFAWRLGDHQRARTLLEEGLSVARMTADTHRNAVILNTLGNVAWSTGNYHEAREHYEDSLALRLMDHDLGGAAMCLNNLGTVASDLGEFETARSCHEQSLAIRRKLDDGEDIAQSLHNLGEVALRVGDFARARLYLRDSLTRYRELGTRMFLADELGALARLADAEGEPRRAVRWFATTAALRSGLGIPPALTDRDTYARSMRRIREQLGDEQMRLEWQIGETAPLEDVLDEAVAWLASTQRSRRAKSMSRRSSTPA